MKTLLLIAMTITTVAGSVVAEAQIPVADTQGPFRFELEQANGPRGLGVEGHQRSIASRQRRRERDGNRVRLGVGRG